MFSKLFNPRSLGLIGGLCAIQVPRLLKQNNSL